MHGSWLGKFNWYFNKRYLQKIIKMVEFEFKNGSKILTSLIKYSWILLSYNNMVIFLSYNNMVIFFLFDFLLINWWV